MGAILRYGLVLWGNSTRAKNVFIAQKKCIRALCNTSRLESCRPKFKSLKVLTLPSLYILEAGLFVKKNINLFKKLNEGRKYASRDPTKLEVPSCRTAFYRKSCHAMLVKIYNKIPQNIRELPTNCFKRELTRCLKGKAYYNIDEYLADKHFLEEKSQ